MASSPQAQLWPWRTGKAPAEGAFGEDFFLGDGREVARQLLGSRLRTTVGREVTSGVVVEVEAYLGPHDPASHAAARIGETPRNQAMFGPPGRAYVFRSYGIHWCLNVVTGPEGFPAAILFRAVDPVEGKETMARRRGREAPLGSGPGRLAQALAVTGEMDSLRMDHPPLELLPGWELPDHRVEVSGRVGIRNAADWPLRFYLRGHSAVSRGPRSPTGSAPDQEKAQ